MHQHDFFDDGSFAGDFLALIRSDPMTGKLVGPPQSVLGQGTQGNPPLSFEELDWLQPKTGSDVP
ncbi:MAG: hypothetical protein ABI747_02710 [Candidatus Moraniibacteriota bacterium]